ncbi:hypothetical protein HHL19_35425 [Streptomyces sp. R302]|uniref:hypothetical protein n=1 Tax=unclassified Streptomyces TaxID=2593676 RepID=UPI00145D7739|nr:MULTISPECIES: hypothetical protein [unclassified Streptomyces]NML55167.1 hypothetical protein [Streptomyces sp. R301]NML83803.1 hypothetical protein [Streptomyces sp. R302]
MQMNRQTALGLIGEGKAAYAQGNPSDASPYNQLGGVEDRFGYRYWIRGWLEARSAAETQATEDATTTAGQ